MAATLGAFVGGETAGALFVLWKTAMGARINGAWATPRMSPGSRSVALYLLSEPLPRTLGTTRLRQPSNSWAPRSPLIVLCYLSGG